MPHKQGDLKPISVQDFHHYYLSNCTSATARFDFMDSPKITAAWNRCKADTKGGNLEITSINGSFSASLDSVVEVIPRLTDEDIRHGEKSGLNPEPSAFALVCDDGGTHYTLSMNLIY